MDFGSSKAKATVTTALHFWTPKCPPPDFFLLQAALLDFRSGRAQVIDDHTCLLNNCMSTPNSYALQAALLDFRSGKAQVMVATDIAARGLHITGGLPYIVNYDFPGNLETYVHR